MMMPNSSSVKIGSGSLSVPEKTQNLAGKLAPCASRSRKALAMLPSPRGTSKDSDRYKSRHFMCLLLCGTVGTLA